MPGFEGLYEAGPGAVRSLDRTNAAGRRIKGRVLKPGRLVLPDGTPSGYFLLTLSRDRELHRLKLHRVIAAAFHGEPEPGQVARHLDGDPLNNHPDNLRWGTLRENHEDSVRHGTHKELRKTHCPREHKLVAPNLRPDKLKVGHRVCLACQRGRDDLRYHPYDTLQELSDWHYARIMKGVTGGEN